MSLRVKPLEWEAEDGRPTCLDADGCGKLYRVLTRSDGSAVLRFNASNSNQTEHESTAAAKAAAQADYESRILSALAPIDAATAARVLLEDFKKMGNNPHDPQATANWRKAWDAMSDERDKSYWNDWPFIFEAALLALANEAPE